VAASFYVDLPKFFGLFIAVFKIGHVIS
jgi:hypothetical protein